jgi:hypothetical protein
MRPLGCSAMPHEPSTAGVTVAAIPSPPKPVSSVPSAL